MLENTVDLVLRIGKAFANGSSVNLTSSKTQLSKMIQSGGVIHGILIFGSTASSLTKKATM